MEHRGSTGRFSSSRVAVWPGWLIVLVVVGAILGGVVLLRDERDAVPAAPDRPFAQIAQDEHGAVVWALATSSGAGGLATATITGEVMLKDLVTGRSMRLQNGAWSSARSLSFAPNGRILAVAGIEPAVRFWEVETGAELEPLAVEGATARNVAFSPDGTILAVSGQGSKRTGGLVTLWSWPGRRRLGVLSGHSGNIFTLAFARDGSALATGDSVGEVKVWDVARGRERMSFRPGGGALVKSIAYSPDGALLATAQFLEKEVRFWDASTGESRGILPGCPLGVNALAFAPDGARLAMAQGDGTATVWDLARRGIAGSVAAPGGSLQSVAFLGEGRILVTGGVDGVVREWELAQVLGRPIDPGPSPSHGRSVAPGPPRQGPEPTFESGEAGFRFR